MASNRHLGRIIALQTLYEYDFRVQCEDKDADLEEILSRNLARYEETVDDKPFVRKLTEGVSKQTEALDAVIQPLAQQFIDSHPKDRPVYPCNLVDWPLLG